MAVWNKDLVVQLLNKLLNKADLTVAKTDDVLADTKQILAAVSGGIGVVKSVQRGTAKFTAKVTEANSNGGIAIEPIISVEININSVNPDKCAVLLNGSPYHNHVTYVAPVNLPVLSEIRRGKLILALTFPGEPRSWQQSNFDLDYVPKVGDIIPVKNLVSWQVIEFY